MLIIVSMLVGLGYWLEV